MEGFTMTLYTKVKMLRDYEVGESYTSNGIKYTKLEDGGWISSIDKRYIECEYDGCTEGAEHNGLPQVKIFIPKKGQTFCSTQCRDDCAEEEE